MWSVSCLLGCCVVCVENNVCEDGVYRVMPGGGGMSEKAASVPVVNCVQFAFL